MKLSHLRGVLRAGQSFLTAGTRAHAWGRHPARSTPSVRQKDASDSIAGIDFQYYRKARMAARHARMPVPHAPTHARGSVGWFQQQAILPEGAARQQARAYRGRQRCEIARTHHDEIRLIVGQIGQESGSIADLDGLAA